MNAKTSLHETANLLEILAGNQRIDRECVTLAWEELATAAARIDAQEARIRRLERDLAISIRAVDGILDSLPDMVDGQVEFREMSADRDGEVES